VQSVAAAIGGPCWFLFKCLLPVAILVGLGLSITYVRLLNGPISLQFLAAPISRSIAAELPGVSVAIEDALVRLTDSGSIEFRMRNVRFSEVDGAPIAVAPLAAVSMSANALWSGRLAPDKIVLIEPRLLLVYSEGAGLSMSFAKGHATDAGTAPAGPDQKTVTPPAAATDDAVAPLQQIDLGRLIAQAGQRARRGADAASFLREIGVRNATIILDRSGRQTVWTVIEGNVDLEHKKRRSIVTGSMSLASSEGPWGVSFKIEEAEKANSVVLEAAVRDLVPRGLSAMLPEVPLLEALDFPLNSQARVDLSPEGGVVGGTMKLEIGRGVVVVPGFEKRPLTVDNGYFDIRYDARSRQIVMAPSTLQWSQGHTTMVGTITGGEGANAPWVVDIKSTEGRLSTDEFAVPPVAIEEATVQGVFAPDTGLFAFKQARLRAGGAQVDAAGEIATASGSQSLRVEGRIGPVSVEVAKAIWPRLLAPGARRWVGRQVNKARLTSAGFKVWVAAPRAGDGGPIDRRVSMTMEAADVSFVPAKTLAAVDVPRALLRIEGDGLEISVPEATSQVASGRRLTLKAARFTAVDIYGEPTLGEIAFRLQAPLPAAVDYLEQESLGIGTLGLPSEGLDGKVEGQFKINLPLIAGVEMSDFRIEGKVKVADGRAKQAIGPHDIQGATINIDVGDGSMNATGQMLVGGVGAKLSFQRIMGGMEDKQPPLRLTANLDAADRNQLGIDVNHIVSGDIPVDLMVTRGPRAEQQVRVRADLSGAELNIEPIAWRKPPGRQALLEFDVVRGPKGTRTDLHNFRVVGDDIAIDGNMVLDGKGRLTEFHFPNFALTLVSRSELQGTLRTDNVWDIKTRGQYWDGREFFRRLFSLGQAAEKQSPVKKDQAGVDLKADFDTIQGHGDIALKGLRLQMSRRAGRLSGLLARGNVEGGKPIEIGLQQTSNEPRKLVVMTEDAGQAFRMVGFYPNMQGGEMRLDVNLDGKGAAEKTGLLDVRRFALLGDPVLSEVLQTSGEASRDGTESGRRPKRKMERQSIDFDSLELPFSVGYNQFVLQDAQLRGPLLGASLTGKADFKTQLIDIGGTYSPLQGLNSLPSIIPGAGQVLTGSKGEGMVGITFRVSGPMAQPQVQFNPLSLLLPGFTRGLSEMGPSNPRVIPRDEKPAEKPKVKLPQAPGAGQAYRQAPAGAPRVAAPEISGGWSTERKQ
jgi:hypothetical protein